MSSPLRFGSFDISRRSLFTLAVAGLSSCARDRSTEPGANDHVDVKPPLEGRETYSESVYADAVSADGLRGFILRIGRYPDVGISWAWGHVFHDGEVFAFTNHELPCTAQQTDLEGRLARYSLPGDGPMLHLERRGERAAPTLCTARAQLPAHRSAHPPHGPGDTAVRIDASFAPAHEPVSSLSGRTEVLGDVSGSVEIDGPRRAEGQNGEFAWRGHFHEQVRTSPRWMASFCYATLRGDGYQSVAIKLEQGAVGFVIREGRAAKVTEFEIEAPSETLATRRFVLALEDGERIEGTYQDTYVYSVPIYDVRRRGSIVVGEASGTAISGCVNDYLPHRLTYLV